MRKNPPKNFRLILFVILVLAASGSMGFILYNGVHKLLLNNELEKQDNELPLMGSRIVSNIEALRNDNLFLSRVPPIQGVIRAGKSGGIDPLDESTTELWRNRLETIFIEFLRAKPNYMQIRYIGVADNGREIVRVHRDRNQITVVDKNDLQSKGDRPYFKESIRLNKNEVYLSEITLNHERGKMVEPHVPVLRAAVPVYDKEDNVFGIVVVNMGFDQFLKKIIGNRELFFVTNDKGDFLAHPDISRTFGFEFGALHRIQDVYPELIEMYSPGSPQSISVLSKTDDYSHAVHFHKVHFDPLNPERFLALSRAVKEETIISEAIGSRNRIIFSSLAIIIAASIILIYFIMRLKLVWQGNIAALDRSAANTGNKVLDKINILDRILEAVGGKLINSDFKISKLPHRAKEEAPILLVILIVLLAAGIFILDLSLPLGVASGVLYVILALIALWMPRRYIIYAALLGTFLTLVGYYLSPPGSEYWTVIWNRGLAFFVIWLTAALGLLEINMRGMWQKSEKRLRAVVDNAPDGIIAIDHKGIIQSVNPAAETIFGYPVAEMLGNNVKILMPEPYHSEHDNYVKKYFSTGETNFLGKGTRQLEGRRKDGSVFPMEISINETGLGGGKVFIGIMRDVTERQKAQDELSKSLEEKEILLKEVHHRTKNNLQIVSSLLSLQSEKFANEAVRGVFQESIDRIQSIALLHENIYQSDVFSEIMLEDYLKTLAMNLLSSFGYNSNQISLEVRSEVQSLNIDKSIYCGLIINELVSNSLKHAFSGKKNNAIKININRTNENKIELIVSDNGVGIPNEMMAGEAKTMGLKVVHLLATSQLEGVIDVDNSEGTVTRIVFKGET